MQGRGLFLDLDGTAADSLGVMRVVYEKFLTIHDRMPTQEEFESLNGPPLREVVRQLKDRHQLEDEHGKLFTLYQDILFEVYSQVSPMPGVVELLTQAQEQGWKTALVTSNSRVLVEAWLEQTGVNCLVDVVVTAEDVIHGKPSAEPYMVALDKTGCKRSESIAVEDGVQGARSALAAGLNVLGLGEQEWPAGVCPIPELGTVVSCFSLSMCQPERDVVFALQDKEEDLPERLSEEVDALWQTHTGQYDGEIVTVWKTGRDKVDCRKTTYRRFYAQTRKPEILSGYLVHPLAVTGLLVSEDGVIFGRRSDKVHQDQGMWELAPAGGVDPHCTNKEGQLDLLMQLAEEAKEELGLELTSGQRHIIGMIEDRESGVFDVGLFQKLARDEHSVQKSFQQYAGNEYDEIRIVPMADLNRFLATERVSMVSRKLVCTFMQESSLNE